MNGKTFRGMFGFYYFDLFPFRLFVCICIGVFFTATPFEGSPMEVVLKCVRCYVILQITCATSECD